MSFLVLKRVLRGDVFLIAAFFIIFDLKNVSRYEMGIMAIKHIFTVIHF